MTEPVLGRDYVVVPTYDELRAELASTELDREMWHDAAQKAEARIAKAKAILEGYPLGVVSANSLARQINDALAALEGK